MGNRLIYFDEKTDEVLVGLAKDLGFRSVRAMVREWVEEREEVVLRKKDQHVTINADSGMTFPDFSEKLIEQFPGTKGIMDIPE
jgi:hypothetical protein